MLSDNHFANGKTLSVSLDRTVLGVFAGTTAIDSHGCYSADDLRNASRTRASSVFPARRLG